MTAPTAIDLFSRLNQHVDDLLKIGQAQHSNGAIERAESIFRACLMLTIASLDTFMHQKSAEQMGQVSDPQVLINLASYLNTTVTNITGRDADSIIRYHLSFKTLVAPQAIDKAIEATGTSATEVWRKIGIDRGSRESRLRNSLDLFVDRRNTISHEGDWDPVQLSMHHISSSHVTDCQECVRLVATGINKHWS